MPFATINAYLDKLPVLQAELCLMLSQVIRLPHMNSQDAEQLLKQWEGLVFRSEWTKAPVPPAVLRMIGIGVRHVAS